MREFILSCATAAAAIAGKFLTWYQIKASNKQSLFEKRVKYLIESESLAKLYKENREDILGDREQSPLPTANVIFGYLTNNSHLYDIGTAILNPLDSPLHQKFLTRLEDFKELSLKIELSFSDDNSKMLNDFIIRYQEVLHELYKYQIFLNKMENSKETIGTEEMRRFTSKYNKRLWNEIDKLDLAYNRLIDNDCISKLENKTKLHS